MRISNSMISNSYFNIARNNNNNSSFDMSGLSDLASIKNGSYGKLLKSYYNGSESAKKLVGNKIASSSDKINTTKMRDNAAELKDAASKLADTSKKNDLFQQKEIKSEDGTVKKDYDREAIGKAVADFADKYNSFIDSAADSNNKSTLRTTTNLIDTLKANKKLLDDVGINIGSNNKLSVDPSKLENADMNKVKTLFNGPNSITSDAARSASEVQNQSISDLVNKNIYAQDGRYQYSGSNFDFYL